MLQVKNYLYAMKLKHNMKKEECLPPLFFQQHSWILEELRYTLAHKLSLQVQGYFLKGAIVFLDIWIFSLGWLLSYKVLWRIWATESVGKYAHMPFHLHEQQASTCAKLHFCKRRVPRSAARADPSPLSLPPTSADPQSRKDWRTAALFHLTLATEVS